MEMKKVHCAKCGKPEMVSAEQAAANLSREEVERKLLNGERNVPVLLCDKCIADALAFRKTLQN